MRDDGPDHSGVPGPAGSPAGGDSARGGASRVAPDAASQAPTSGKTRADGSTVYRLATPLVVWWVWVVIAVANLADLAIQGHNGWLGLQVAAGIVAVTGLLYACALRPRVLASELGITVVNPFRDYEVPWGAVKGVYLAESVEIECARAVPKKEKTIYTWALYSPRRSRLRTEMRQRRASLSRRPRGSGPSTLGSGGTATSSPGTSLRAPSQTALLSQQQPGQLIAAELGQRASAAQTAGAKSGTLGARWAMAPIAAVLVPSAALAAVLIVH